MGYEYGIWFLIKNRYIDELVERFNTKPHIPHITIMCNMTLQDATGVYDSLKISDFKECLAIPITNLKLMEGNYCDEKEDIAYGLEFSIDNWYQWIETIKRIVKGDVPISPHLSIIYRDKEYEDELQDRLLNPEDDESTELGDVPHEPRKGIINRFPGSNAAYGMVGGYRG